ncbi:unnamed protein product [Sordaria macrospora k-hell]|uniref:WGS project CABT00000000 data, contig 2.33 n=1 Tax=Sordaria macrospora (strain ATCC MYA-333 / DSM 997 / K(L3346) / K-hell) TaxID=771870 RepID=F7W688_SORMK|nr:uncharacterized protein SMAC_06169 [Sordaria macrospora k-hell]CCC13026.1 unnamed protein product [Sordaria macrospora k-hell]
MESSISSYPVPVSAPSSSPNSHIKPRTKRPSIKPSYSSSDPSPSSPTSNDVLTKSNIKPENRPFFSLPTPDQSPNLSQEEESDGDGDGEISPLDSTSGSSRTGTGTGTGTGTPENEKVAAESVSESVSVSESSSPSPSSGTDSPAIEDYDDLTISPDAMVQRDENGDDKRNSTAGEPPAAFLLTVTMDGDSDENAGVSSTAEGNGAGGGEVKQIRPTITVGTTTPSTTDIHNSLLTAIEKQCQRIEGMSSTESASASSPIDWPWTHTVFFVMHGMVMLMKMHSYAFYNGYLASVWKKRQLLLAKLKELEHVEVVTKHDPNRSWTEPFPLLPRDLSTEHLSRVPSAQEYKERRRMSVAAQGADGGQEAPEDDVDKIVAAIDSREPLDEEQVHVFERALKWEVDAMTDELRGKATDDKRVYPNNLTLANHYEFIVLPTLVYELEYPRSESINWYYAAEKMVACFGVIFVMIIISQAFIYPVVMETVRMKEIGMPLSERFQYFPWMLADLIFPFMMEYLLSWYLIWETILNFVAELTKFADRSFYDAWWNCVSWDQFARDWNRPVHNFLLRHVYHSSISAMKVDKHTATLITFFLSACVHELVMWCIFKKLRGYLLFLQMFQLPLVSMSRTKWMRNRKTLGNVFFWLGIFTGPSILCSLYLIL